MTLDLDTHCSVQNTQSHELVVLVAALSGAHERNDIYYTTISLLLYLEKTAVGAFSSSLSHYIDGDIFILAALNDNQKKTFRHLIQGLRMSGWSGMIKALHKFNINRDVGKKNM